MLSHYGSLEMGRCCFLFILAARLLHVPNEMKTTIGVQHCKVGRSIQ